MHCAASQSNQDETEDSDYDNDTARLPSREASESLSDLRRGAPELMGQMQHIVQQPAMSYLPGSAATSHPQQHSRYQPKRV